MEHTHTHRLEGGVMMGKDYMLAIIIVNYDGRTHTHTHTQSVHYRGTRVFPQVREDTVKDLQVEDRGQVHLTGGAEDRVRRPGTGVRGRSSVVQSSSPCLCGLVNNSAALCFFSSTSCGLVQHFVSCSSFFCPL